MFLLFPLFCGSKLANRIITIKRPPVRNVENIEVFSMLNKAGINMIKISLFLYFKVTESSK